MSSWTRAVSAGSNGIASVPGRTAAWTRNRIARVILSSCRRGVGRSVAAGPKEPLGVGMGNLVQDAGFEVEVEEPIGGALVVGEWVVDGEHQSVVAEHFAGQPHRAVEEVAAGGDPEVVPEVLADGLVQLRRQRPEHFLDSGQMERKSLAEMAQDDL